MTTLREALQEAIKMHRPACVVSNLKGYHATELTEDEFTFGTVEFIVPDNGATPVPISGNARGVWWEMIFEAIGGPDWHNKHRPPLKLPEHGLGYKPKKFKLRK